MAVGAGLAHDIVGEFLLHVCCPFVGQGIAEGASDLVSARHLDRVHAAGSHAAVAGRVALASPVTVGSLGEVIAVAGVFDTFLLKLLDDLTGAILADEIGLVGVDVGAHGGQPDPVGF